MERRVELDQTEIQIKNRNSINNYKIPKISIPNPHCRLRKSKLKAIIKNHTFFHIINGHVIRFKNTDQIINLEIKLIKERIAVNMLKSAMDNQKK